MPDEFQADPPRPPRPARFEPAESDEDNPFRVRPRRHPPSLLYWGLLAAAVFLFMFVLFAGCHLPF